MFCYDIVWIAPSEIQQDFRTLNKIYFNAHTKLRIIFKAYDDFRSERNFSGSFFIPFKVFSLLLFRKNLRNIWIKNPFCESIKLLLHTYTHINNRFRSQISPQDKDLYRIFLFFIFQTFKNIILDGKTRLRGVSLIICLILWQTDSI